MSEQERVFAGGGEMGARMRSLDWNQTPLGPVEGWPPALRVAIGVMLAATSPMALFWSADYTSLYNDSFAFLLGAKHPKALGASLPEAIPELWDGIGPLFDQVTRTGTTISLEKQHFFMNRQGFMEEVYFTVSFLPLRDEHGRVVGLMETSSEATAQVLGERRFNILREVSIRTALASGVPGVLHEVQGVLAQSGADVPFSLLYRVEADCARRVLCSGLEPGGSRSPETLVLGDVGCPWPLAGVLDSGQTRLVEDLGTQGGALHAGPWPEPVSRALLLPLALGTSGARDAVLVVGLSPRLPLDESYRDFLQVLARQVSADVLRAQALEQETLRAAKLAEMDRVKTAFFSNVSHEFRTPLTLMLGPTEAALASPEKALRGEDLQRVHRNELRLLKLVNTLLDLSRLEAGRTQGRFVPTDLAPLTAGFASAFDSTVTKAGLRLTVDCPALPEPVWVDPDLWEKIVLNLVSNAFKYTLKGEITVRLRWRDTHAELSVQDTGTGIALEQQALIFERFHRVEGARGRSDEGTGIGLSLVRELVELHGGRVRVRSVLGEGSTFTVELPAGRAHLPPERVLQEPPRVSTAAGARAFVQEAEQWAEAPLEVVEEQALPVPSGEGPRGHVLLADDNADMRDYLARLLEGHFRVEAVVDGQAALEAARVHPPDMVLSDVMMPRLDGFGLVRELKADARTAHVPVLLLSARASEKATLEGFAAGGVDYMVKPFRARELLARVDSLVKTARAQAEVAAARARMEGLIQNAPIFICAQGGPQHVFQVFNPLYQQMVGSGRPLLDLPVREALPEVVEQGFAALLDRVYTTGEPFLGNEMSVQLRRHEGGPLEETVLSFVYQPRWDARGQVEGVDTFGFEVTELVRARQRAEVLARQLSERVDFEQKLMGIVSHDLRNPLSAILLGASFLMRQEGLDGRITKSLVRIQSSAERATRMVKDLLDFTQARLGGGLRINRRAMDLHEVVLGVVAEVEVAWPARGLELRQEGDGRGDWDSDRLAQVVQNLVTNALKYSPEDSRVRVLSRAENGEVLLSVANGGPPIPADKLATIFEPMQRATEELDNTSRSVGLGLYIVKSIVEAHGGRIHVTSTPQEGTRFTVSLPREGRLATSTNSGGVGASVSTKS